MAVKLYIREWRDAQGITSAQLCARAKIAPATLSRIETGQRVWTATDLEALAKALKLPPEALLTKPD